MVNKVQNLSHQCLFETFPLCLGNLTLVKEELVKTNPGLLPSEQCSDSNETKPPKGISVAVGWMSIVTCHRWTEKVYRKSH